MEHRRRDELIEKLMRSAFDLAGAVRYGLEKPLRDENQLTFARLMILRLLAERGPCNVNNVAGFLAVSNADASALINKLVKRKLLQRVESRCDRRIRELSLTHAGNQLLSDYERARKRLLAQTFLNCSVEDLLHASEVLDRVSSCISSHGRVSNARKETAQSRLQPASRGFRRGSI
jgi:DNA-binding MarR family transcriptional regulator